jgi:hypothetical protein
METSVFIFMTRKISALGYQSFLKSIDLNFSKLPLQHSTAA